jgi:hypothetical protein
MFWQNGFAKEEATMPDDSPDDNLKTIWQDQPTEAPTMTLETIRLKANEYRSKTRRTLFSNISTVAIVVGFSVFGILHTSSAGSRLVFAIAIAWALVGQSLLQRGMWSERMPADATFSTGLEFYRREVEQQQDLARRVLEWSFGPVVLSICTLVVTFFESTRGGSLRLRVISSMPFTLLFAIWIIAFFVLRSRDQRRLRQEIEALSDIEKASRR